MNDKKEQRYFLEIVEGDDRGSKPLYIVTGGKRGKAVFMFSQKNISTLTEQGWKEQPHSGFEKVEIAADQENVLVYYTGQKAITLPIPTGIDPDVLAKNTTLTGDHLDRVIIQMKEKDLYYDDFDAEYFQGINTTYGFNKEKNCYTCTQIDIIVGSFMFENEMSVPELKETLLNCASLYHLRKQGFDV
jgi:hypothetical protein